MCRIYIYYRKVQNVRIAAVVNKQVTGFIIQKKTADIFRECFSYVGFQFNHNYEREKNMNVDESYN